MHASDLTRVDASAGARTPTTRVPVPTRVGAWRYALALHACVLAACAHPAPAYPASSAPLEALVPDGTQTLVFRRPAPTATRAVLRVWSPDGLAAIPGLPELVCEGYRDLGMQGSLR